MSAVKVVMIDNYDSFTYNLVQYLGELGADVEVVRNDQVTVDEIVKMQPDISNTPVPHRRTAARPSRLRRDRSTRRPCAKAVSFPGPS